MAGGQVGELGVLQPLGRKLTQPQIAAVQEKSAVRRVGWVPYAMAGQVRVGVCTQCGQHRLRRGVRIPELGPVAGQITRRGQLFVQGRQPWVGVAGVHGNRDQRGSAGLRSGPVAGVQQREKRRDVGGDDPVMGVHGTGSPVPLEPGGVQRQQGEDAGRTPPQPGQGLVRPPGAVQAQPLQDRPHDLLAQPPQCPLQLTVVHVPFPARGARRCKLRHSGLEGADPVADLLSRDAAQGQHLDGAAAGAAAYQQGIAPQRGHVDDGDGPVYRCLTQLRPVRRPVEVTEAGERANLLDHPVELRRRRLALLRAAMSRDQFRADLFVTAGQFGEAAISSL